MTIATRTLCDLQGNTHVLEVGSESLLLDGRPCTFLRITHEHIQIACADTAHPITLATATFWRDLAGADPSAEDAGEILAHRLAAWASQRTLVRTLQSTLAQIEEQGAGSSLLPISHLDPLTEQVLQAFDGNDTTTQTLARILKQPPEVVCDWAMRLGLTQTPTADEPESPEQQAYTETEDPITTGPLEVLLPTEAPGEAPLACQKAGPKKPAREWFRWTPERVQTLEEGVARAGGWEQMTQPTIKRLAAELGWPWKSLEYQVGKRKRERPKEAQSEPATPEEDRREAASSSERLLYAS